MFELKISKNNNFRRMQLLFLSDLHLGKLLKKRHLIKILKNLLLENVDIVIFGGDLLGENITKYYSLEDIRQAFSIFDKIKYRYAVIGNHETKYQSKKMSKEEIDAYLHATGFKILKNESEVILNGDTRIAISGLLENHRCKPDIEKSLETIPNYDRLIVIIHQPDYFMNLLSYNPDLVLSGHSHGGQITLFGHRIFIARGSSKFYKGIYKQGKSSLVVSSGVGNNLIKMRLFSPPNVYFIRLL